MYEVRSVHFIALIHVTAPYNPGDSLRAPGRKVNPRREGKGGAGAVLGGLRVGAAG